MAISEPFDPATPPGSEQLSTGDDKIRSLKLAIREREERGGHYWPVAVAGPVPSNDTGKHCCGGDPQGDTKQFIVYEEDRTTAAVTIDTDEGGIQSVTLGDGVAGSNAYTLKADVLRGKRDHTIAMPLPASAVGRVKGMIFENRNADTITLLGAKLICFTTPVGGALDVDLNRIASGYTDPNVAGTTVFSGGHPQVAAGAFTGSEVTAFTGGLETLATGEAWVVDIDTIGPTTPADNIVLLLRVQRIG